MANDLSSSVAAQDSAATVACSAPSPARQRDVLFGAGCGLLCFGLFPFSGSSVMTTPNEPHTVEHAFDASTRALSATFALTGLVCVVLSCVDVPARAKLRAVLVTVLVPLAVATVLSGASILRTAHTNDVVTVLRHTRVLSFDEELRIEPAVNDLYCTAKVRQLCGSDDRARTFSVLGLSSSPQIEAACVRAEQHKLSSDLDPLALILEPTQETLHWCGQYVATHDHDGALDLTQSPYQQHHAEVIDELLHTRVRRHASAKLLMLLEWFAVPALCALVWWLQTLSSTAKIHVGSPHVIV